MQLMNYFKEVFKELKNVTFPTGQDVKMTSVVIVIILIIVMIVVGFSDFLISKIIKTILGI